jgi:hypothetical protein
MKSPERTFGKARQGDFHLNPHALAGTTKHENAGKRHSGMFFAGIQKNSLDTGFRRYDRWHFHLEGPKNRCSWCR